MRRMPAIAFLMGGDTSEYPPNAYKNVAWHFDGTMRMLEYL